MAEATARGLRYPTGDDLPVFPDDFDRLASDIDKILPRTATGCVRITPTANTPTGTHVSFPDGRFDSTPLIIASPITTVPGGTVELASYGSPSKTGTDIYVRRTSGTATSVAWAAFQMGGGASVTGWQKPQYDGASNTTARPSRYLNSLQAAVRAGMLRVAAGHEELSGSGYRDKHIEFPDGRFTAPPTVLVGVNSPSPGAASTYAGAVSAGAAGFDLYGYRSNSNSMEVNWVALQLSTASKLWTPGGPADLAGTFAEFAEKTEAQAPRVDAGEVRVPGNGTNTERAEFQPGLFTAPPIVVPAGGTSASTVAGVSSYNATATGVDVYVQRSSNVTTGCSWLAVQVD